MARATPRSAEAGFTLIEILCAMVLTALLSLVFASFFGLGARLFTISDPQQSVNLAGRLTLNRICRDLRTGRNPVRHAASDLAVTCDDSGTERIIRYYLSGDTLYRSTDNASAQLLLSGLDDLTFTLTGGTDNRVVTIALGIATGSATRTLQTACLLRNTQP